MSPSSVGRLARRPDRRRRDARSRRGARGSGACGRSPGAPPAGWCGRGPPRARSASPRAAARDDRLPCGRMSEDHGRSAHRSFRGARAAGRARASRTRARCFARGACSRAWRARRRRGRARAGRWCRGRAGARLRGVRVHTARQPAREEPVHERRLSQPRGRMGDEPRGLVDDEQVLVLEHHVQVELDRSRPGPGSSSSTSICSPPRNRSALPATWPSTVTLPAATCRSADAREPISACSARKRSRRMPPASLGAVSASTSSAGEAARAVPRPRARRRGTARTAAVLLRRR